MDFPECVAKGSRFTLGAWGPGALGVGTCSLDAAFTSATTRNRPQPSATVRVEVALAVPLQKWSLLINGGFQRRATSFRVAGVALRDIPTCFITCQKSLCVTGPILLRRFQKMGCIFRGRRSTLQTSMRGRRSTSQAVVLRAFCESHWQRCVKS